MAPRNYKEILIRQGEDLLTQIQALNGGENADSFRGDQVRCLENINQILDAVKCLVVDIINTGRFDELDEPVDLAPKRQ